jgi:hypothetical protein
LAFDAATTNFLAKIQQGMSPLDPDDNSRSERPTTPEQWFGLLCAGIICAGPAVVTHLNAWLDESNKLLGEEAALTHNIRLLIRGMSLPVGELQATVRDATSSPPLRCGAAAKLLLKNPPAETTFHLQALLSSGLVGGDSFIRQQLFNRHVAQCFSVSWRTLAQNRFQFYSPSTSVPALLSALDEVEYGNGTMKSVLIAAASALRQRLGEYIQQVL